MSDDSPEKTCFIAMPVRTTEAQAEAFGDANHWKHIMDSLFVPAVKAAGFTPWLPVSTGSDLIQAEIVRQLEQADMVLVDMSHSNPNVFFELGVRTSVNRPVALLRCDATVPIPFDVSGINAHTYIPTLRPWNIDAQVDALADHLKKAEASCAGQNPLWRQFGLSLRASEPTSDATPADARMEVLTQQVSDLSSRVSQLIHPTRNPLFVRADSEWDYNRGNEVSGSLSVFETMQVISQTANTHNVGAEIYFDPEDGFFVRFLQRRDADKAIRFREEVKAYMASEDLTVTFVGPDIEFPNTVSFERYQVI